MSFFSEYGTRRSLRFRYDEKRRERRGNGMDLMNFAGSEFVEITKLAERAVREIFHIMPDIEYVIDYVGYIREKLDDALDFLKKDKSLPDSFFDKAYEMNDVLDQVEEILADYGKSLPYIGNEKEHELAKNLMSDFEKMNSQMVKMVNKARNAYV